jgi:hypothetical protein
MQFLRFYKKSATFAPLILFIWQNLTSCLVSLSQKQTQHSQTHQNKSLINYIKQRKKKRKKITNKKILIGKN